MWSSRASASSRAPAAARGRAPADVVGGVVVVGVLCGRQHGVHGVLRREARLGRTGDHLHVRQQRTREAAAGGAPPPSPLLDAEAEHAPAEDEQRTETAADIARHVRRRHGRLDAERHALVHARSGQVGREWASERVVGARRHVGAVRTLALGLMRGTVHL